ncbi:serpin family protein [Catenulispora rubra]|uniref:serpin family protein n=1 Tax=Catenulispora rubra TaxID=280293 RepID=UPI00189262E7|nr:serpin family protein [Catenulispora rubra]
MAVGHVNALTKRWLATVGADAGVLSAVGVWPLLAFLADGADEETGRELSAALGVPAEEASQAARELLAVVEHTPAIRTALGLWTRGEVQVFRDWLGRLPADVHGELTGVPGDDQRRLDAWASDRTEGLIPRMPIEVKPDTMLVLASALLVTLTWRETFRESTGPWADAEGGIPVLRRTTPDLSLLRIADTPIGPVTTLRVESNEDVDVHLVLGPVDGSPSDVLAVGSNLVGSPLHGVTRGSDLPVGDAGPGVRVAMVESSWQQDSLEVTTVPFRIEARHDLLDHAALFGLQHATDDSHGHFPGVSDYPLFVNQALQDAVAEFSATGFRAAAVTAIGMFGAAMPRQRYQLRHVAVAFDRPFAYYAVHRDSGLILVAGWVSEPLRAAAQDVSSGNA